VYDESPPVEEYGDEPELTPRLDGGVVEEEEGGAVACTPPGHIIVGRPVMRA
jgi:hypothetical protein